MNIWKICLICGYDRKIHQELAGSARDIHDIRTGMEMIAQKIDPEEMVRLEDPLMSKVIG